MYKLNQNIHTVWLTPTTLQFGIDEVVCTLENLTPSKERFISSLQMGFTYKQLPSIAKAAGITTVEAHQLLFHLSEVCRPSPRVTPQRICVDGSTMLAKTLASTLAEAGHRVVMASARNNIACDLAFLIADFVIEPYRAADWLRREIPHVPIVAGDAVTKIGPLLAKGNPALCNHCIELHHRDKNPAWPVIASQLLRKPSGLLSTLNCQEISTALTRWITHPDSLKLSSSSALTYLPSTGSYKAKRVTFHPECSCQALPQNAILLGS